MEDMTLHAETSFSNLRLSKKHEMCTTVLVTLPPGAPFPMRYDRAKIDHNAFFVCNQQFGKQEVAAIRTKYHRSS